MSLAGELFKHAEKQTPPTTALRPVRPATPPSKVTVLRHLHGSMVQKQRGCSGLASVPLGLLDQPVPFPAQEITACASSPPRPLPRREAAGPTGTLEPDRPGFEPCCVIHQLWPLHFSESHLLLLLERG